MSYQAAVITVSDKGYQGMRVDTSGPAICAMLRDSGIGVNYTVIVNETEIRIILVEVAIQAHATLHQEPSG